MIKINLLGDEDLEKGKYTLVVGGYFASVVATVLACFLVHQSGATKINKLTMEKDRLENEVVKLKEVTKKVKEFETKKIELANKLTVIATLKKSKMGPVRVLDDLNTSIPERSWLTEIKEVTGSMSIGGIALDNQTIASFMQTLEGSNYFSGVDLEETKHEELNGAKVKIFRVRSKINYTGIDVLGAGTNTNIKPVNNESKKVEDKTSNSL
jgi:type IV pilus assembly protein PilN